MSIFDIFSSDPQKKASRLQIQAAKQGKKDAYSQLDTGTQQAVSAYQAGLSPYQSLFTTGQSGYNAYADATGANGPAGMARALAAFQTSPGYQFSRDQGIQSIDRNRAAQGMLASGNTDTDIADFVTGLANQEWQNYVSNLSPFINAAQGAAGGIAGQENLIGGTYYDTGVNKAGIAQDTASTIGQARANAALAPYSASANMVNALMNAAKLIPGLASLQR
jgi:hypothetical protein